MGCHWAYLRYFSQALFQARVWYHTRRFYRTGRACEGCPPIKPRIGTAMATTVAGKEQNPFFCCWKASTIGR